MSIGKGTNAQAGPRDYDFVTYANRLAYGCRLRLVEDATCLYVMLRSSLSNDREPPVFWRTSFNGEAWRRRIGATPPGHVLFVSDPMLMLESRPKVGTFIGTRRDDGVDGLLQVVDKIAGKLGIARDRVIFWGRSGAGFAAAMCAIRRGRDGRSISINAALDLSRFRAVGHAAGVLNSFDPEMTVEEVVAQYPMRTVAWRALKAAQARNDHPRMVLVQNRTDTMFYLQHYRPFCRAFSAKTRGGMDPTGTIFTISYKEDGGHGAQGPEVISRECLEGLPFLLDGVPPPGTDPPTQDVVVAPAQD